MSIYTAQHDKETELSKNTEIYDVYAMYEGLWSTEGKSYEEIIDNGGMIFTIDMSRDEGFDGDIFYQQAESKRVATIENIIGDIENGKVLFDYTDDGWGNNGSIEVLLSQEEVIVKIDRDYEVNSEYALDGTFSLKRMNTANLNAGKQHEIEEAEKYQSYWSAEQIMEEKSKRESIVDDKEYYEFVNDYKESQQVTDGSWILEPLLSTDSIVYSKEQFEEMPKLMIHIVKNEIYARHGYVFKDDKLQDYFEMQLWYVPNREKAFDLNALNSYEKANLEILAELDR
ncbi:YARHG domain-containing protein [Butyrivibrio sp. M55]|nr:YARHG domain-containing protein [Butyrivibrio sp. M55]